MKPSFRLTANGADLTAQIADRLLSLKITDEAGIASDQLELHLDDRYGSIELPETGAWLEVAIGYSGKSLVDMGKYGVDEIEASGWPASLVLRGKAADMKASLKSQRNAEYHQTTLGKIISTIAARHALAPAIASDLKNKTIDHLDQTYESDLNLLTRLADQYGAIFKPAGGALLFVRRGAGVAADGSSLPTMAIDRAQIQSYRVAERERENYTRIGAHYLEKKGANPRHIYAGVGDPLLLLRHPYKTENDALTAASAKLASIQRGKRTLNLTLIGMPELCAEMPIELSGLRAGADGRWRVTRAEHTLDGSGLHTAIEAEAIA